MKSIAGAIVVAIIIVVVFSSRVRAETNPFLFQDYNSPASSSSTTTTTTTTTASTSVAPPPADAKEMTTGKEMAPPLRVAAALRPAVGLGTNVELYGGATLFQDGTLHVTDSRAPGAELRLQTQSEVGAVAGIKLGFTWPSFDAIAGDRDKTYAPELVEPALAADFFWTGYRYKAQGSGSTTTNGGITASYDGDLKSDVNTYTFCVEPLFRFNLGAFRPYVGFGFGGTYIDGGHAHLDGNIQVAGLGRAGEGTNLTGSSNDIDFTAEGLAGFEFFVDPHWALTFDYKYVWLLDPTFHASVFGSAVKYDLDGLGSHVFTGGFSYYF